MKRTGNPALRSARILVAVTACVVVTFVLATVAADHHASNITSRVEDIAGNAMPSVQLLSRARGAVLRLMVLIDEIDSHQALPADALHEIRSLEEEITSTTDAYLSLPFFPSERILASPLHATVPAFSGAVHVLMDRLTSRAADKEDGLDLTLRRARQSALALDDTLERLVEFDAGQGQRLGLEILKARIATRRLLLVSDSFGVVLAFLATFLATRALGRTLAALDGNRERAEQRASEYERRTNELDQFSGRLAHDLVGPMSVAGWALDMARRSYPRDEQLTRLATRGLSALQRVRAITDALLRFARAGARPEPNARTEVQSLLIDLIDGLTPEAEAAGVHVELDPIPATEVACSPGALMSILGNLIRNAIKHMGPTEVRRVTVRASRSNAGLLRFEVQDTGPGIPETTRSRIFEPYFQATSGGTGIGLGLATVERLVQAHGGRIGVSCGASGGSTFWFELPLVRPPARAQPSLSDRGALLA